jgi:ribosome-associated protein
LESQNEERSVSRPDAESIDHQDSPDSSDGQELCASKEARKLAVAVAAAGLDKKASGIEIIDVTGKVDYAEVLVLMTGRSDRHVHAIAKGVQADIKKDLGTSPLSVEGLTAANWVLIDFNDVVVHVFQQEARLFYDLEGLWIDAGRIAVPAPPERQKKA